MTHPDPAAVDGGEPPIYVATEAATGIDPDEAPAGEAVELESGLGPVEPDLADLHVTGDLPRPEDTVSIDDVPTIGDAADHQGAPPSPGGNGPRDGDTVLDGPTNDNNEEVGA